MPDAQIVWNMPCAATAVEGSPTLTLLPRRIYSLCFAYRDANDTLLNVELRFNNVAAVRCSHLPALTIGIIKSAYGKLVEFGASEWSADISQPQLVDPRLARHLAICFDDGPCYEFLCESFHFDE